MSGKGKRAAENGMCVLCMRMCAEIGLNERIRTKGNLGTKREYISALHGIGSPDGLRASRFNKRQL